MIDVHAFVSNVRVGSGSAVQGVRLAEAKAQAAAMARRRPSPIHFSDDRRGEEGVWTDLRQPATVGGQLRGAERGRGVSHARQCGLGSSREGARMASL